MPQPGAHVFQGNANAFANNAQYSHQGIQMHNSAGPPPPPPPPQFFYPPSFPPNLPPPPFPPPQMHNFNSQNVQPPVNHIQTQNQGQSQNSTPQHTPQHITPQHNYSNLGKDAFAGMGFVNSKPATPNGVNIQDAQSIQNSGNENASPLVGAQGGLQALEKNIARGLAYERPQVQSADKMQTSKVLTQPSSQIAHPPSLPPKPVSQIVSPLNHAREFHPC